MIKTLSGIVFRLVPQLVVLALSILAPFEAHPETAVEAWVQIYNGPGNKNDFARALAVDPDGNVFVTGYSDGTNIYPYNADYTTIKYSAAGIPLWTNRYNGPANSEDEAVAIAIDPSGNLFVAGHSVGSADRDYATLKYSAAGVPLWTNRYNGPSNRWDYVTAMTVDVNGNVIVTGQSFGSHGRGDYATVKYSNLGVPLWTNRYNGSNNSGDNPSSVVADASGNVFVTGDSWDATNVDYVTIKYSDTGRPLWTNQYNGPASNKDLVHGIAVDGNGDVFVTGESSDGTSSDYLTIKYSNAGTALWTNRYNGPGNHFDVALALAVDNNGNVFVTGTSARASFDSDYATIKYSNTGLPLWTNRYDANSAEGAYAVAVDSNGNILVTGNSGPFDDPGDCVTIKYSNAGMPLWTNRYSGPNNNNDSALAMAVDVRGNVFVTGTSSDPASSDYATIKYIEVSPVTLRPLLATNNVFNFSFTNTPGAHFTVLSATNLSLPANEWSVLGQVIETVPGQFTFTNSPGTSSPQRFYRLRLP